MHKTFAKASLIAFTLMLIPAFSSGQFLKWLSVENDTSYVWIPDNALTVRTYFSTKFTGYNIIDNNINSSLKYKPNTKLIMGLGFNYGILGINVGYGMPFFQQNQDDGKYGETDYLDLQMHLYLRKITIDYLGQFFTGYYLSNPQGMINGWQSNDSVPKRPDIKTIINGVNVQYIFNNQKFSYRSSFVQTEWQKKSSGSFILGLDFFYITARADSSFIPHNIIDTNFFSGQWYNRSDSYNFGTNVGYAHTFIIIKRMFLSVSAVGGLSLDHARIWVDNEGGKLKTKITPGFRFNFRLALGYHFKKWYAGTSYVNHNIYNQTPVEGGILRYFGGNVRLNIAYKILLKKPIKFMDPKYW